MMAQDFHDLTGQVIAKVVNLAAEESKEPSLSGPVVAGQAYADVVTDQSQVDDLLASLGSLAHSIKRGLTLLFTL